MTDSISHSIEIDPYGRRVIVWGVLPTRPNGIRIEYTLRERIVKWIRFKLGLIKKIK